MTTEGTVLSAPAFTGLARIRHGFFTRQGGQSTGIYASLNCGLGSNDQRETVLANRDRVARYLGAASGSVITVHQTHGTTALHVEKPFPAGAVPKADALVTATPGVVVAALAADCTPVLFVDPGAGIVAAAHAGWRGALAGILESTVAAMERLGANRDDTIAAIGPCISQANYEVGPDLERQFSAADPDSARFFSVPPGKAKAHLDLPGYVALRLRRAGVAAVDQVARCTYAEPETFYSYRRATHRSEPDYGRQISAIVVT